MKKKVAIKVSAVSLSVISLIVLVFIFRHVIVSFVSMYLIGQPYIRSESKEESKEKGVYLYDYRVSKNSLQNTRNETVIMISDSVFIEKKHALSYKKLNGMGVMDDSYLMIIPCRYSNDYYQQYQSKWELNPPFSAHPNHIKADFENGTAMKSIYPPDTISLYLMDLDGNVPVDSIQLIKKPR